MSLNPNPNPLVQYSSSDEEDKNIQSNKSIDKFSKSIKAIINPAPLVKNDHLFSNLPAVSSKEITRNLPLNDLEKLVQGSFF